MLSGIGPKEHLRSLNWLPDKQVPWWPVACPTIHACGCYFRKLEDRQTRLMKLLRLHSSCRIRKWTGGIRPCHRRGEHSDSKTRLTSTGGLLSVSSSQYNSTLKTAFAKATSERDYGYRDTNRAKQTGYSKLQGTIRNGRRCSTAKAFLIPAQDRKNFHIFNNAHVTKVLINSRKVAYGVRFDIK
ncbi:hypothetical protein JTE90_007384 [Oedothorax gibbosus]|uniref:Glucose-methanol-choline oxidoreductase N-terminal domain-containing protein n=1 Tax=Oedothorax gibbosus TaxID=931172 RepID=A0AAV6TSV0_9ARAC|nr:hypothetical protein JTE90_007384 [Oedothorax gibbosus]